MSQMVSELTGRIADLEAVLRQRETKVATLTESINSFKKMNNNLRAEIDSLSKTINKLEERIEKLTNKGVKKDGA